ncbi:hypothetical protein [Paracoccus beibuensis]|uniref:hypothetical protein n=1 Tax=Paracoccus beibuensis TaxID=547602 RepID=UPI00223FFBD9|nr:hypothetical protein [Paracoccus beibuensis]
MFRPVPFALILVVMLTSIGLGAARGTVRQGTEVVLCTGHGVVVTVLPDDGGRAAHVCPDMALAVLVAVGSADVALPQRVSGTLGATTARRAPTRTFRRTAIRVRDPPVLLVA